MCVRPRQDTLSSTLLCKTPNPEAQTTSACFELYQRARCLRLAFQCSGAPTTFGFQVSGSLNLDWIFGAWGSGQCDVGECIQALGSRAPTPPPWYPAPPPGPQPPCPRTAPAPSGPAQPERTHANQREGTMENEPHQSRDRGTVCKEKRAILYGNEHVTMTLQPYHTYLCRTHCPTQAGRGQPKRPQAPPHRGGRGQGT